MGCGPVYDPSKDQRLTQDMETELAADVEFFKHPTKGRVRLRGELVHPPGSLPTRASSAPDDEGGVVRCPPMEYDGGEFDAPDPETWEPA